MPKHIQINIHSSCVNYNISKYIQQTKSHNRHFLKTYFMWLNLLAKTLGFCLQASFFNAYNNNKKLFLLFSWYLNARLLISFYVY